MRIILSIVVHRIQQTCFKKKKQKKMHYFVFNSSLLENYPRDNRNKFK